MQYCNECNSVEQGTITKYEDGFSNEELIALGQKEANRLGITGLTKDELIEWGKDQTAYEICAACESEDDTMINVNEDEGLDR